MGRVDLNQLLRVVEGGCRFGEIDAVLRNVRFFFLGIPFKSHPLDTGTIWDNINIEVQYNFVGNRPSARQRVRVLGTPTCHAEGLCGGRLATAARRGSLNIRANEMSSPDSTL